MTHALHSLRRLGAMAVAVLLASAAGAATSDEVAITIYSSAQPGAISPELYRPIPGQGVPNAMAVPGYALVRDDRDVKLKQGRSQLSFTDVAALIDPTTVTFASLTDPRTRVLEQNFQFDLVSTQKLLLKFIDQQITRRQARRQRVHADHAARCSRRSTASCCEATTAASTRCPVTRR